MAPVAAFIRGSDSALAAERREQVNLVDGNDGWVPCLARAFDQAVKQRRNGDHLFLAGLVRKVKHDREPVLPHAPGQLTQGPTVERAALDVEVTQFPRRD